MTKSSTEQEHFSKEEMAAHAYEVLNLIVGDLISAAFLHSSSEHYGATAPGTVETQAVLVSLRRNKLRLVASALFRYTQLYSKRLNALEIGGDAERLNQRFHNHQVEKLRHLFEHELSQFTGQPHSPEQVKERFKLISALIEPNFPDKCHELAKQVIRIRDQIGRKYVGCGKGVDRWKVSAVSGPPSLGHDVATMTAGTLFDKESKS